MHHHFTDMFNGHDMGVVERVMYVDGVSTSAPVNPTPQSNGAEPENAPPVEAPKAPEAPKVDDATPGAVAGAVGGAEALKDKPAEAVTPENKGEVERAVDNGTIEAGEKSIVENIAKRGILAEVKGDADAFIADKGDVKVDKKLDVANAELQYAKDKGLTGDQLKGHDEAVRIATEQEGVVADVIKAEQKSIGANQAEIDMINANKAQVAKDLDRTNADGQKLAEEFNANGGFTRNGGGIGDGGMGMGEAWDQGDDMSFDEMYRQYSDNKETWTSDFVKAQGDGVGDGDDAANEGVDETVRTSQAERLVTLFDQRAQGETANENAQKAIDQRNDRIEDLRTSQQEHFEGLSGSTQEALRTVGIDPLVEQKPADKPAESEPAETTTGEQPKPEDVKSGEHLANAPGDLAKPEHREQLLQQGVAAGVIPQNVGFNDQGQAVYTVQEGDSYWSITERLNNNTFDPEIWNSTMQSNAQLLDRTGSPDIINPGDQIVVPYFTQQRYAEMLPK